MRDEAQLKAQIRADLPAAAFRSDPSRLWLLAPLLTLIVAGSSVILWVPLPLPVVLATSCAIGVVYASLFFFGHEIAHGAVIRSRRIQTGLMYVTFLICCTSPHFFRFWHNHAHHRHTNVAGWDPDMFGTLEQFEHHRLSRVIDRFAPGSGHWLSIVYLFTFFTVQSQGVLWLNSQTPVFDRMNRRRAKAETLAMASGWIGVCVTGGPWATVFLVLIPMLMANFILMSYIVTNHMVRPLVAVTTGRTVHTTMSVTTWRMLDLIFFKFSHHVEHHLFPAMSSRYFPAVRRSLLRHAKESYLAPPHLTALRAVFQTPRIYEDPETLIDPQRHRRVSVLQIEAWLRGERCTSLMRQRP